MKTRTLHSITSFAVSALLLGGSPATAADQRDRDPAPVVTGAWAGFYQGIGNPNDAPNPVLLTIDSQRQRRYAGELQLGGPDTSPGGPHVFEIDGTLAARSHAFPTFGDVACANNLFDGKSRAGKVHGDTEVCDFGGGAAVMIGRLRVHLRESDNERGGLILLRNFVGNPNEAPPDASGLYEGTATIGGEDVGFVIDWRAVRDERGQVTTAMDGSVRIGEGESAFEAALLGTINAAGEIVAIAQAEGARLILGATFIDPTNPNTPAQITGVFQLRSGDGSVREGEFEVEVGSPGTELEFAL